MIVIPLTRGYVAHVDDEDSGLASFKWSAAVDSRGIVYAIRSETGNRKARKIIRMHRQILGARRGQLVDHVTHEAARRGVLDNRRQNLRLVSGTQNNANARKVSKSCSSPFKGVCWHIGDGRWSARIKVNGRRRHLGSFRDEGHAVLAYDLAAVRCFGEHALTNFPVPGSRRSLFGGIQ